MFPPVLRKAESWATKASLGGMANEMSARGLSSTSLNGVRLLGQKLCSGIARTVLSFI